MTSAHSKPLIAGALNPNTDFHDFSDDELGAANVFSFSDSPDTLQSLDTTASANSKDTTFLNPQELTAGLFPDSPNDSYHDSSSESAESTKRTGSTASAKTPASSGGLTLDSNVDIKMEWGHNGYGSFDDDDTTFNFGSAPEPSNINGLYGFGEQDDSFMDQSFDFESASSSPDALSAGPVSMASPGMPTIKTNSPQKTAKSSNLNRTKPQQHKKHPSVSKIPTA